MTGVEKICRMCIYCEFDPRNPAKLGLCQVANTGTVVRLGAKTTCKNFKARAGYVCD